MLVLFYQPISVFSLILICIIMKQAKPTVCAVEWPDQALADHQHGWINTSETFGLDFEVVQQKQENSIFEAGVFSFSSSQD